MNNFLKCFRPGKRRENKIDLLFEYIMRNISYIDSLTERVEKLEAEKEKLQNEIIEMKKLFNPN